jgi:nucleoside-diphosphate-sugar epimerase
MLIVVTGATGFIGRHLVSALASAGHHVRAIVRDSSNRALLPQNGVEALEGSLLDDDFVRDCCQDVDIIYSLAGKTGGPSSSEKEMRRVNVDAVQCHAAGCCQEFGAAVHPLQHAGRGRHGRRRTRVPPVPTSRTLRENQV